MNKLINIFNKNGKTKNSKPFTVKQLKKMNLFYHIFREDNSVYYYKTKDGISTLVENGKIISQAYWDEWKGKTIESDISKQNKPSYSPSYFEKAIERYKNMFLNK